MIIMAAAFVAVPILGVYLDKYFQMTSNQDAALGFPIAAFEIGLIAGFCILGGEITD